MMIHAHRVPEAGPPAVNRGRHAATAVVALSIAVTTLGSNVASPLYGLYQQRFGFSSAALAGIFSVYALGVVGAMLTVGPLSDRIGRRRVMLPALVVVALGGAAFCLAQNLGWLIAGRLLTGLGTGALVGAGNAALVETDPEGNRERAAAIATVALTVGGASGPAITAVALHFDLWPTVLPFVIVSTLALVFGCALGSVSWPSAEPRGDDFRLRGWRPQRVSVPRPILGRFALAAGALALSWSVGSLFAALGPTLATTLLGIQNRAQAGLIVVVFQLCGGVFQVLARSQSARRTLSLGPLLMTGGMVLCVLGFQWLLAPFFVLGALVAASGFGMTFVGSAAALNRAAPPAQRGEVSSAFYVVGYTTMTFPVLGVGFAADAFGLKPAVMVFTVILGAGSVVIAWFSRRCEPERSVVVRDSRRQNAPTLEEAATESCGGR
ncbi:MAG: MFS transporter [Actinomycetota bacterium]